jgi:cyclopropane-fatty-acyl-phospholipid synthase
VRVRLCDYREIEGTGRYDAIVSVEMIEAVGERYWPDYFSAIDRLLAPGGTVAIQAITMAHKRFRATRHTYTWIHKYIFPGGLIPSVPAIHDVLGRHTALKIVDQYAFGAHYAATLRLWRERFLAAADRLAGLGFDDVFRRTWEFYLAYSQAGFATGYLDVHQLVMAR